MVGKTVAPVESRNLQNKFFTKKAKTSTILMCVILALYFFSIGTLRMSPYSVKVLFPLSLLKPEPVIVDPNNLETTPEYYLLENLALGLVRDSLSSASGFEGGLSESWIQVSPRQWKFRLRKGQLYSDGSSLDPREVVEAIKDRASSNARHLKILPKLTNVDLEINDIILTFSEDVDNSLLSELSLADAAIITKKTKDTSWRTTLSPYYVEKFDYNKTLDLRRNDHCPLVQDGAPEKVELVFSTNEKERLSWFEQKEIDLYDASAFTFKKRNTQISDLGYEKIFNQPNVVHFFVSNRKYFDRFPKQVGVLNKILEQFDRQYFVKKENFSRYNQLIPKGYSGALLDFEEKKHSPSMDLIRAKIEIFEDFKEWPEIKAGLENAVKALKLDIDVVYFDRFSQSVIADNVIARTFVFKGNQKDSLGSWNFLFHPEHGPLREYKSKIQNELTSKATVSMLQALHKRTLDESWAIPFFIEAPMVFYSSRVSLERWNPFDMRLRFYEIRVR